MTQHDAIPRCVTIGELAEAMSCSEQLILNEVHKGRIPAVKIGDRTIRIPLAAVQEFLATRTVARDPTT